MIQLVLCNLHEKYCEDMHEVNLNKNYNKFTPISQSELNK